MSYAQAMKWAKKHPKGIKIPPQYPQGPRWPAAICPLCGWPYTLENHIQACGDPEYNRPGYPQAS